MITSVVFTDKVRHKGKLQKFKNMGRIEFIIKALESYEESVRVGDPVIKQAATLFEVIKQATKWKTQKDHKISKDKSIQTGNRMDAVKALIQQAYNELWVNYPNIAKASAGYSTNKNQYNANPHNLNLSAPKNVYQHEKSSYDTQKAKGEFNTDGFKNASLDRFAPSATLMHGDYKPENNKGKSFNNLTDKDFARLDKKLGHQHKVIYFSKTHRLQFMVEISGGIMSGIDDAPFRAKDTSVKFQIGDQAYAIDKYFNMFAVDALVYTQKTGTQINHTSLCAGNEVICAGTVAVDSTGKVVAISNNSGHYAPTTDKLKNAVQLMEDCGVNLADLLVVTMPGSVQYWGDQFKIGGAPMDDNDARAALLLKVTG